MINTVNAVIVDDESLSRDNISHALKNHPNWRIKEQFDQANHLLMNLDSLKPDVVFLDVNMPGISGIEAAKTILEMAEPPLVVFVTAFDEHAIEAFELMAVDYLLKPFSNGRFNQTIKKIEYLLADDFSVNKLKNWQHEQLLGPSDGPLNQLVIRSVGSIKFIKCKDIYWIKASGNYTEIHHAGGVDLQRITIKVIEEQLDAKQFMRVHRSAIIKLSVINEIKITDHNCLIVVLDNGDQVKVSAAYKNSLLGQLNL